MRVTAKHIIRRWYERYEDEAESLKNNSASGIEDELIFDQFIYLWISFNGSYESIYYQNKHHNNRNRNVNDDNKPKELTLVLQAVEYCFKYYDRNGSFHKKYPDFRSTVSELLKSPEVAFFSEPDSSDDFTTLSIRSRFGSYSDSKHSAKTVLRDNVFSDLDKLRALATLIYKVRCNLFHGQKGLKSQKDVRIIRNSIKPLSVIAAAAMEMVYE